MPQPTAEVDLTGAEWTVTDDGTRAAPSGTSGARESGGNAAWRAVTAAVDRTWVKYVRVSVPSNSGGA